MISDGVTWMPCSSAIFDSMANMPSTKLALPPSSEPFSMRMKFVLLSAACTAQARPLPPPPTMSRSVS